MVHCKHFLWVAVLFSLLGFSGVACVSRAPGEANVDGEVTITGDSESYSPDAGAPDTVAPSTPPDNDLGGVDGGPADAKQPNAAKPSPPSSVNQITMQRSCASIGANLFKGQVCDASLGQACVAQGCFPAGLPAQVRQAASDFFSRCQEKNVICVRPQTPMATLQQAADAVKKDQTIDTILIASGLYRESIVFENLSQNLSLIGQSNDRLKGVRIVAPPAADMDDAAYAALRFVKAKEIKLENLVVQGGGHGVFASDFVSVTINHNHFVFNSRSGARLEGSGVVSIENSVFQSNGAIPSNPNGSVSVTINHNHRVSDTKTGVANIKNEIAVTINHNHRVSSYTSARMARHKFGLVSIGAKEVTLKNNVFSYNGAGGISLTNSPIAVTINHNHRTAINLDKVSVTINHNHRVVMEGNRLAHNGPMGLVGYQKGKQPSGSCQASLVWEGGRCFSPLLVKQNGTDSVLGVGAVIAGYGEVSLTGNSFFANDVVGLVLHSADKVSMKQNALERNGVRPWARLADVAQVAIPAYAGSLMWGVTASLDFSQNLVLDHLTDGVLMAHPSTAEATKELSLTAQNNHFAGSGRLLPTSAGNMGNGLRLTATFTSSPGVRMAIKDNFFHDNRRVGFSGHGRLVGQFATNYMTSHLFRALLFHDTYKEASPGNTIEITSNVIDGASGYGIQLYGGAARFMIEGNTIANVVRCGGGQKLDLEGDAINLTDLSADSSIKNNTLMQSARAGIFFTNASGELGKNTFKDCTTEVMTPDNPDSARSKMRGAESYSTPPPSAGEMQNRKNF